MLEPINRDDFRAAQATDPDYYHDSRFYYYQAAIRMAAKVAPAAKTVIELGPHRLPIFRGADTMDIRADVNPTFHHDGGEIPWPIKNGAYDLFVSLQTFEHLGSIQAEQSLAGRYGEIQRDAFAEVRRIAHSAIISLPWQWNTPGDVRHHGIGWKTLDDWFGARPPLVEFCGRRVLLGFPSV